MTSDGVVPPDLEEGLAEVAESSQFNGTVLVTRDDREVVHLCRGVTHRGEASPITPLTRFGVASACKMFTAATVLLVLAREGVDVHTPVAALLPGHRRPRTLHPDVSVHHLLSHTSAMGDYAEEDPDLPGFVADYADLWAARSPHLFQRPDDFLPLYDEAEPVAEPGDGFHYNNAGFILLAALVEELTGRSFVEGVADLVLAPCGMTSSGYFRSDETRPDVAVGHLPPVGGRGPWRTNVFSLPVIGGGDGGAFVTAADMDRFLRALAGGRLLGRELTEAMLTPWSPPNEDGDAMGYGTWLGEGWFGHDGGDPGVRALALHWPGRDVSLVVLSNQGEGYGAVARRATELVLASARPS